MSQSTSHLILVQWTWQWVQCTSVYFSLPNHQSLIQYGTVGLWYNGRFTAWMCNWQICSNYMIQSFQHGPASQSNVPTPGWNPCNKELRLFWEQSWVPPSISMVFLIKCIMDMEAEAKLREQNARNLNFQKLNINIVQKLQICLTLEHTPFYTK